MNGLLTDDGISWKYNKNSGINERILGQGTKAYKFQRAFVEMMPKKTNNNTDL